MKTRFLRPLLAIPFLLALSVATAQAGDEAFTPTADGLITATSQALATVNPTWRQRPRPPRIKNLRLRKNLKEIRAWAVRFRDQAAKGKPRCIIAKGALMRLRANLRTANYLVQNGAAFGMDSFPPNFEAVRNAIGSLTQEMCCGEGA